MTQKNILAALATYERTLVSPKSRFDRFLDRDNTALTQQGRAFSDMLLDETQDSIILADVNGESTIQRADLDELICHHRSQMPERLEAKLRSSTALSLL